MQIMDMLFSEILHLSCSILSVALRFDVWLMFQAKKCRPFLMVKWPSIWNPWWLPRYPKSSWHDFCTFIQEPQDSKKVFFANWELFMFVLLFTNMISIKYMHFSMHLLRLNQSGFEIPILFQGYFCWSLVMD